GFDPMTGKYQTDDGKPDPNYARKQEQQDRERREAEGATPTREGAQPAPGQRSELPGSLLHFIAGGRDVGAPPVLDQPSATSPPGRAEWQTSREAPIMGADPNVIIEQGKPSPPAPPPALQPPPFVPSGRQGPVFDPDI